MIIDQHGVGPSCLKVKDVFAYLQLAVHVVISHIEVVCVGFYILHIVCRSLKYKLLCSSPISLPDEVKVGLDGIMPPLYRPGCEGKQIISKMQQVSPIFNSNYTIS